MQPETASPSAETLIELSPLPSRSMPQVEARAPRDPKDQIVETEDANNQEVDPNATLLSDRNQKASKETKAATTDDFRKGIGKGQGSSLSKGDTDLAPTGEPHLETNQDSSVSIGVGEAQPPSLSKGIKRNWKTLTLKDLSVGAEDGPLSASDDYLPHVESGERTILSTREFRYFSYYNRIKDLLRQFWKPSIEREVAKLWGKGHMLKENELTTRVLVLLDRNGKIQKISKVGASGVSEIDEAAVQAFYQAAPFPNPPAGLIDNDGYVRINWDFILQTASAPRIQYRPSGPNAFR